MGSNTVFLSGKVVFVENAYNFGPGFVNDFWFVSLNWLARFVVMIECFLFWFFSIMLSINTHTERERQVKRYT